MKIVSIHYEKVFPIAPYQNEKIGIEIQVDEGDDTDEAFKIAKETVEMWGNDRQLSQKLTENTVIDRLHVDTIPVIRLDNDASFTDKLSLQIANCKSLEELALLRDASKSSGMIQIYMAKARRLTPKTVNV